jgi:hypothetical protein
MIERRMRILVLLLGFTFMVGCMTMSDVIKSKPNGQSNVYSVNPDQAWEIARTVFRWAKADAIEEHRKEGYLVASSGANVMGAWIEAVDKKNTRVTALSKRRIPVKPFTDLSEKDFHDYFAQGVEIIKSGKRLPASPPKK